MSKPPPVTNHGVTSDHDKSWLAHAQKEKQEAPKRLEETAKFLVAVISLSLTIFISKRPAELPDWTTESFRGVALIWMVSVLLSFGVLFPWPYSFREDSPEDIQRVTTKIATYKYRVLILSVLLFLGGLGLAVLAFMARLE